MKKVLLWLIRRRIFEISERVIGQTGIKFYPREKCAPGILCGSCASHEVIQRYALKVIKLGKPKKRKMELPEIFVY